MSDELVIKVGVIATFQHFPHFPADKDRFAMFVGPGSQPRTYNIVTFTSDDHGNLGADHSIPVDPGTYTSIYKSPANKTGLLPKAGKIGLWHWDLDQKGVFEVAIMPSLGIGFLGDEQFTVATRPVRVRMSEKDYETLRENCPSAYKGDFHAYNALG